MTGTKQTMMSNITFGVVRRRHQKKIANVPTPSDSVAGRATIDNLRLAAEQGFTPIIARTEYQNRGSVHERVLKFHPRMLEVK
jgi:hypothetical protein